MLMKKVITVKICLGTTCFVMGAAKLQEKLKSVLEKYGDSVDVKPVNCLNICANTDTQYAKAPYVMVDNDIISEATVEKIINKIEKGY
jgi:NADH:ubiquinone oxidoreductase subunit E